MTARRRNPNRKRRVKPYLLPNCPIEKARGLYRGEGSFFCEVSDKYKKARLQIFIGTGDYDALKDIEPCFGVPVERHGIYRGKEIWRLRRVGRASLAIAQTLADTPLRRKQIQDAVERCKKAWQKGYTDATPI